LYMACELGDWATFQLLVAVPGCNLDVCDTVRSYIVLHLIFAFFALVFSCCVPSSSCVFLFLLSSLTTTTTLLISTYSTTISSISSISSFITTTTTTTSPSPSPPAEWRHAAARRRLLGPHRHHGEPHRARPQRTQPGPPGRYAPALDPPLRQRGVGQAAA
jgi:hypothetical protein